MIDFESNMNILNAFKLTNADLVMLFSFPFLTTKSAKVILRVKITRSKKYPRNGFCYFKGRKILSKTIPLKRSKLI